MSRDVTVRVTFAPPYILRWMLRAGMSQRAVTAAIILGVVHFHVPLGPLLLTLLLLVALEMFRVPIPRVWILPTSWVRAAASRAHDHAAAAGTHRDHGAATGGDRHSKTRSDDPQPTAEDAALEHARQLLQVRRSATRDELRSAYARAALRHHPDRVHTEHARQMAHARMQEINAAYTLLRRAHGV